MNVQLLQAVTSLLKLAPSTATLQQRSSSGALLEEREIPAALMHRGDLLKVGLPAELKHRPPRQQPSSSGHGCRKASAASCALLAAHDGDGKHHRPQQPPAHCNYYCWGGRAQDSLCVWSGAARSQDPSRRHCGGGLHLRGRELGEWRVQAGPQGCTGARHWRHCQWLWRLCAAGARPTCCFTWLGLLAAALSLHLLLCLQPEAVLQHSALLPCTTASNLQRCSPAALRPCAACLTNTALQAERIPSEGLVSQIAQLVEAAQLSKAPIQVSWRRSAAWMCWVWC